MHQERQGKSLSMLRNDIVVGIPWRYGGRSNSKPILILINDESTHSFMDAKTDEHCGAKLWESSSLQVPVAYEQGLMCRHRTIEIDWIILNTSSSIPFM